jgi:hypothetical protein
MLKLIQVGNSLPFSYPLDPTSTFEPGQIGQLKLIGNDIVIGVSDGTAPLGIIDDTRSAAFTRPSIDETVVISATGVQDSYGRWISTADAKQELNNAYIVASSFVADYEDLVLNPVNGVLTAPAGSELNYDLDGDGVPDSIRTLVSYVYQVSSLPGEDTTIGSSRVTIWFNRGIYATDQFDTTQKYAINSAVFVNADGKLTTKQVTVNHPAIAIVTGPPGATVSTLEFMWL